MDGVETFRDMFIYLLRNKPIYYDSYREVSEPPPDHTVINDVQQKIGTTIDDPWIIIRSLPAERLGPFVIKSGERWFIPDGFDEYCVSYTVTDNFTGQLMTLPVNVTFILSRNRDLLRIVKTDRPDGTIMRRIYHTTNGNLLRMEPSRYTGIEQYVLRERELYNGTLTEFKTESLQRLNSIFSDRKRSIRRITPPVAGTWTMP
jgi:hypothetical protein